MACGQSAGSAGRGTSRIRAERSAASIRDWASERERMSGRASPGETRATWVSGEIRVRSCRAESRVRGVVPFTASERAGAAGAGRVEGSSETSESCGLAGGDCRGAAPGTEGTDNSGAGAASRWMFASFNPSGILSARPVDTLANSSCGITGFPDSISPARRLVGVLVIPNSPLDPSGGEVDKDVEGGTDREDGEVEADGPGMEELCSPGTACRTGSVAG